MYMFSDDEVKKYRIRNFQKSPAANTHREFQSDSSTAVLIGKWSDSCTLITDASMPFHLFFG